MATDTLDLSELLTSLDACDEAREWADGKTPQEAWDTCPRGEWLLWIAERVGVDRRLVRRAACACARTALRYVPEGEDRPRLAIETAERWCDGLATDEELAAAWAAARGAARAATRAAAWAATRAAARGAAWDAAGAAARGAAWDAAGAAAWDAANQEHARLVRGIIPFEAALDAALQAAEGRR